MVQQRIDLDVQAPVELDDAAGVVGVLPPLRRGLHSSTCWLDVSTYCGIFWVVEGCQWPKTAQLELRSGRVEAPADRPF